MFFNLLVHSVSSAHIFNNRQLFLVCRLSNVYWILVLCFVCMILVFFCLFFQSVLLLCQFSFIVLSFFNTTFESDFLWNFTCLNHRNIYIPTRFVLRSVVWFLLLPAFQSELRCKISLASSILLCLSRSFIISLWLWFIGVSFLVRLNIVK